MTVRNHPVNKQNYGSDGCFAPIFCSRKHKKGITVNKIKKELYEFKLLMQSVPAWAVTMFVLSVVIMNLLANKSIALPFEWLALDCGIIVSWLSFLIMDIITRHFGPKAATEISVFAILVNLAVCFVLFAAALIDGMWGEAYVDGSEAVINTALNNTFGGTWYVLLGSTVAFFTSAIINNFTNFAIGKLIRTRSDGFFKYTLRTYISTALGQFADNLVFALLVSHFFFGWSMLQCFTCAFTGMIAELICEIAFSYFGYKICCGWKRDNVGGEYLEFMSRKGKLKI